MKSLLLTFITALTSISQSTFAATTSTQTATSTLKASAEAPQGAAASKAGEIPALKAGEYAIFMDESYKVFKTKKYQELELSENCFSSGAKPKCKAYTISLEKMAKTKIKVPDANNFAAINCVNTGGKSLIGLDYQHNEYNFCRFNDGSMVTAWSMYFKTNPVPTIKK